MTYSEAKLLMAPKFAVVTLWLGEAAKGISAEREVLFPARCRAYAAENVMLLPNLREEPAAVVLSGIWSAPS